MGNVRFELLVARVIWTKLGLQSAFGDEPEIKINNLIISAGQPSSKVDLTFELFI